MPQFDPTSFASQIFWLVMSFLALYWIMKRWLLPGIGAVLEERHDKIEGDLEQAERLRAEAETVHAEYEATLADAHQKAAESLRQVAEESARNASEQIAASHQEIQKTLLEAENRLEKAKNAAIADLETIATPLTQSVVKKLASIEPNEEKMKTAIDQAIRETG